MPNRLPSPDLTNLPPVLRVQMEYQRGRALQMVLDNHPIEEILTAITEGIEAIRPGTLCSVLLTSGDGQRLVVGAAPHFPASYNNAIQGLEVAEGVGSCGTAAALGQRVVVEDIASHPYWAHYADVALKAGLRACWSQPIMDPDHKVVGTFAIYHPTPRKPDGDDLQVIKHASTLAALAIDRHRAQQELDSHRHHLERLIEERSATIVQLNAELQRRAEEADAANRAKSAFLADMSHEIRTPLNAVVGLAALLQEAATDPVQRHRTDRIMAASRHLLGTIDAILDLSKIDTGMFTLEDMPLRVEAVVENVRSMIHDRADAKGLALGTDIGPLHTALTGDVLRLQQALLNYAGNAVKFTHQGRVTLRVRQLEEDADSALVRFEVEDSGIGLSPETLSRLFRPFQQADSSIARTYGGSGLGLEITRRFAELIGGAAGADSREGGGSTFWFTARLRKGTVAAQPARIDANEARARLHDRWVGTPVLLAEDEPINAEITQALLNAVGLQVDLAVTGREAVEKAITGHHALVLMDMQMPELDGLDATRELRARPEFAKLPIIAMTANAFAEDRDECLRAGMDGFISKPVLPARLYAEILARLEPADS